MPVPFNSIKNRSTNITLWMGCKLVHVGLCLTVENISANDKKSKSTCTTHTVTDCARAFSNLLVSVMTFHLKLTLKQVE